MDPDGACRAGDHRVSAAGSRAGRWLAPAKVAMGAPLTVLAALVVV
jgi:hypothetical protein